MTLNTRLYITGPAERVDPPAHAAAFEAVNDALGIPKERITADRVKGGTRDIDNAPSQGFCAWVMSHSKADGSLIVGIPGEGDCYCDDFEEEEHVLCRYCETPPHHIEVSMDTSYGYSGDDGANCTVLHARAIVEMVKWCAQFGATLHWLNEYSGEINTGLEGMERFVGTGDQAQAWFQNVAMPFIAAEIAAGKQDAP